MVPLSVALGTAPTTVSTFWPPLNTIRVGTVNPVLAGDVGVLVGVELEHFDLTVEFLGDLLNDRATIRQGPHQGAQKSTSTGTSLCNTSCSKEASVTAAALDICPEEGAQNLATVPGQIPGLTLPAGNCDGDRTKSESPERAGPG